MSKTVRLRIEDAEDIDLIIDLWNELDAALEKKRKKWKDQSVLERFIRIGIAGFWDQMGGRPSTKEGRAEYIKAAIDRLKSKKSKSR